MDRQKMLMIFAGSGIAAALLVFLLYRTTQAPKVQETVTVQAAAHDMPAGTKLKKEDIKTVRILKSDAQKSAVTDSKQLIDRALLFPVTANEPLTLTKVASNAGAEGVSSLIEGGKRAITVPINEASGVAGFIQPRSHVDVLFTRTGSLAEAASTIILEDVVVLAVGQIGRAHV